MHSPKTTTTATTTTTTTWGNEVKMVSHKIKLCQKSWHEITTTTEGKWASFSITLNHVRHQHETTTATRKQSFYWTTLRFVANIILKCKWGFFFIESASSGCVLTRKLFDQKAYLIQFSALRIFNWILMVTLEAKKSWEGNMINQLNNKVSLTCWY